MKSPISYFSFNVPSAVRFGIGATINSIDEIRICLGHKILLVSDPELKRLGLYEPLLRKLKEKGAEVCSFDSVESDPSLETVLKAIRFGSERNATGVIGFGGGSSLDVAKLTALILASGEKIEDCWGVGNAKGPRLPLCLIPTTAGTGSEVTPISIITIDGDEKRGVVSPLILPDLAILDPELTIGLPAQITATTGIDAMVHAIESFSSKNVNNNFLSRTLSIESLKLLGRSIRIAVRDGNNIEARGEMLLGSMLAGMAFANSPVGAVHALAYPIGGAFHIAHGLSNSLVLPKVLEFNSANSQAAKDYSLLAPIIFPELDQTAKPEKVVLLFSDLLRQLALEIGLPTRLRDLEIPEEACRTMASAAIKQTRLLVNNPRKVTEEDAFEIYSSTW